MKKILKWALIVIAALLVAAQVYRPSRTNPPVDESKTMRATTHMTPEVAAILDRSCNDCHSSKTVWPWYSNVAPVSWYLKSDVDDGRRALSLSDWGTYPQRKAANKLEAMCEEVEKGDMPIKPYLLLHPSAKLSDADRRILCEWTKQEGERLQTAQATGQQ
jgi:hypothetical protein